ncbi:MAG: SCO family protein [bacterium]|nr:SCO family protein [bacterium]
MSTYPSTWFSSMRTATLRLRDCLDKPAILTLVYYHCPTICKPLLTNEADVVERTDIKPGKSYNLITVSFDEYDNPETATVMKRDITTSMGKVKQARAWRC